MPYLKQIDRTKYDKVIRDAVSILERYEFSAGDINYIFSSILKKDWENKKSYKNGNKIIGVLECCKLEAYRKFLAPYEEEKLKENGDI